MNVVLPNDFKCFLYKALSSVLFSSSDFSLYMIKRAGGGGGNPQAVLPSYWALLPHAIMDHPGLGMCDLSATGCRKLKPQSHLLQMASCQNKDSVAKTKEIGEGWGRRKRHCSYNPQSKPFTAHH